MNEFGLYLKKLRNNLGMTQQEVADKLQINRSTYTYWETGKTEPDVNNIDMLAKIFDVRPVDIVLEGESDKKRSTKEIDGELTKKELTLIKLVRELPESNIDKIISKFVTAK